MKTCGVCKLSYRTGGGMVWRPADGGGLERVRACQPCAGKAICIVPTTGASSCDCGKLASVCVDCARKREHSAKVDKDVREIAKQLRARAKAYRVTAGTPQAPDGEFTIDGDAYLDGKIEALEYAASFVESGKWG